MNYIIDSEQLDNLLQRRKKYIGKRHPAIFPHIIAGVSLCVGIYSVNFPATVLGVPYLYIKALGYIFAIVYVVWNWIAYYESKKDKYNYSSLQREIKALNKEQHQYSLIAIKDSFNRYPKRVLQIYDKKWQVWFFPFFPTVGGTEHDDLVNIRSKLSTYLEIDEKFISVQYLTRRDSQPKYSAADKEVKIYDHRYYTAEISAFPDHLRKNEFMIEGQSYKWISFAELRSDDNIMAKNGDVIDVFDRYC